MTLRKLALFQSTDGGVIEGTELTEKYCAGYLRLSEYVEVDFPPLSPSEIQAQLARIDEAKRSAESLFRNTCARLDKRRSEIETVYRDQYQPIPVLLKKQAG